MATRKRGGKGSRRRSGGGARAKAGKSTKRTRATAPAGRRKAGKSRSATAPKTARAGARKTAKARATRGRKTAARRPPQKRSRAPRTARSEVRRIDAGRAESPKTPPSQGIDLEFSEARKLGAGSRQLMRKLKEHHSQNPRLSGGDVDAAWDRADSGEEAAGGSSPTPDQAVVHELGEALGLTYEDNEPLGTTEKLEKRDRERWDLDPASSEDYQERQRPARPGRGRAGGEDSE